MKRLLAILMCVVVLFTFTACGTDRRIDGRVYETKGLFTLDEKDPNIQYKVITGNVIWAVLLFETIVFPVYFFGFSMYEAVEKKVEPAKTGG